ELSPGMRRKVAVACAFARERPVLFLDEPTLGLDLHASYTLRHELKQLAAGHHRTIVLSSHDMDVVRDLCQRVIIVQRGRAVVDDQVAELMARVRTAAYTIRLAGAAAGAGRRRREARMGIGGWRTEGGETRFEATVADAGQL